MNIDPLSPPVVELSARLGWVAELETIYTEPPGQCIRLLPEFPGCNPAIAKLGIVWDVLELFASARQPGGYWILNCACGVSSDVGIDEQVFVSHPTADVVVWEIDILNAAPVLAPEWTGRYGFIRLVFERKAYESDIRAMLGAICASGNSDLPVEYLEPEIHGLELEKALALDCKKLETCEPTLPPGTQLEFGIMGDNVFAIDGKPNWGWPTRLFTRWSVNAGFKQWLEFVCRGFVLHYELNEECAKTDLSPFMADAVRNNFFLLRESERTACDRAGVKLVNLLKASFSEGETAPGVVVMYRPCSCPAVLD